jgi:hypothetical protein
MQRGAVAKPNIAAIVAAMMGDPLPSAVLAAAVGARLDRVDVQWHVIAGKPDSLMRFWLTFRGVGTYGFHVGADRERLDVLVERPGTDTNLGRYGRLEVRPPVAGDPAAAAVGQRLVAVRDLFPVHGNEALGARLSFETVDVCVADWGEDLHWASGDLPSAIAVGPR